MVFNKKIPVFLLKYNYIPVLFTCFFLNYFLITNIISVTHFRDLENENRKADSDPDDFIRKPPIEWIFKNLFLASGEGWAQKKLTNDRG